MKKDRSVISDEQRERQLIAEQIEKAKAEAGGSESPPPAIEEGLKREDSAEKVVLSFSAKPGITSAGSTNVKANPLKPSANPLKANPLKRPNVFKSAVTSGTSQDADKAANDKKRPAPMSAAERLIQEDQERKRRRMERDNGD